MALNQPFIISTEQASQLRAAGILDKVSNYFSELGFELVVDNNQLPPGTTTGEDGSTGGATSKTSYQLNPSNW